MFASVIPILRRCEYQTTGGGSRKMHGCGYTKGRAGRPLSESVGAGDGTRTRDLKLGKLSLYQLSYARVL